MHQVSLHEAFTAIEQGEKVVCKINGEKHVYQICGDISLCMDKFIVKFLLNDLIRGQWYIGG